MREAVVDVCHSAALTLWQRYAMTLEKKVESCDQLLSISAPMLATVDGGVEITGVSLVTLLEFPKLSVTGGEFEVSSCSRRDCEVNVVEQRVRTPVLFVQHALVEIKILRAAFLMHRFRQTTACSHYRYRCWKPLAVTFW